MKLLIDCTADGRDPKVIPRERPVARRTGSLSPYFAFTDATTLPVRPVVLSRTANHTP
jgi:hypothetical protein